MKSNETHFYSVKVHFDDVDAAGVLHHPKYLIYFERARCEAMEDAGASFKSMLDSGYALAIADLQIAYKRPVRHLDRGAVVSRLLRAKRGSLVLRQALVLEPYDMSDIQKVADNFAAVPTLAAVADIRMACVNKESLRPARIPDAFMHALELAI